MKELSSLIKGRDLKKIYKYLRENYKFIKPLKDIDRDRHPKNDPDRKTSILKSLFRFKRYLFIITTRDKMRYVRAGYDGLDRMWTSDEFTCVLTIKRRDGSTYFETRTTLWGSKKDDIIRINCLLRKILRGKLKA